MLFLDLDNFKSINDTMGHAAGDRLLVAVAERLQDCLRSTDTAARLGGDEFAVLIESVHRMDEAVMIAERILEVFKQPFDIGGKEIYVGTSIGIATASDDETNAEAMLRNADLAMYLAKSEGKARYVIFEPKMHEALVERVELEADLRRGIEENEFIIHYQPIFDLGNGALARMETFVRWRHPSLGLLPPGAFISFFESQGRMPRPAAPVGPEEPAARAVEPLQRAHPSRRTHARVPDQPLDRARRVAVHRARAARGAVDLLRARAAGRAPRPGLASMPAASYFIR